MNEGQLLLLWPGEVRRKREGDFGQIGPALLAGTNNRPSFINKIPSTSYWLLKVPKSVKVCNYPFFLVVFSLFPLSKQILKRRDKHLVAPTLSLVLNSKAVKNIQKKGNSFQP